MRAAGTAFALASRQARESVPYEAGGILVGWREAQHILVSDFLEIPDHQATRRAYKRRHSLASDVLANYLANADGNIAGYIGEWHSHPESTPASARDVASIRAIARNIRAPIALVVLMVDPTGNSVLVDARIARHSWSGRRAVSPVPFVTD